MSRDRHNKDYSRIIIHGFRIYGVPGLTLFVVCRGILRTNVSTAFLVATISLVCVFIMRWLLIKSNQKKQRSAEIAEFKVFSIPPDQAKQLAMALVTDSKKVSSVRTDIPYSGPFSGVLAPEVGEFFKEFQSVHFLHGDACLSRSEIGPSKYDRNFIKIGVDFEGSELVVEPGKEEVVNWDGTEESKISYPSIYYFLLVVDDDIYGEDRDVS